jgi:hypothetical protein
VAVPIFTAPSAILYGSYLISVVGRYDVRVPEEEGVRDIAASSKYVEGVHEEDGEPKEDGAGVPTIDIYL